MERRAIRVYERALMLTKDEQVIAALKEILAQEQEHFARFSAMRREFPCDGGVSLRGEHCPVHRKRVHHGGQLALPER